MHESLARRDAVRSEGSYSLIWHFIFLNLLFGLIKDVPILLLAHQICLIEWIWGDLNGFDSFEVDAELGEFLYFIRVIC